jgi:hypothetical protein
MKNIGIVSYNIHCNFTNYGSALQSWALKESISKFGYNPILVDYCPKVHLDSDPLNPTKKMWDQDKTSLKRIELSMPAIKENFYKFEDFYTNAFYRTKKVYNADNFNEIVKDEKIDGFVCGSDTIFCLEEFGFDEVYYADVDCMKNGYTVSYAASFGDTVFNDETFKILNEKIKNFKAIGVREYGMVPYLKEHTDIPVAKTIDPTLLLTSKDYDKIAAPRLEEKPYLLLYARRYNEKMFNYAEKIAKERNLKIIDISLSAENEGKHRMFYEAGVEEFLSLVKNADFVVTNSFHGLIFSVQYQKEFVVFSREQAGKKIDELLELFDLKDRKLINGDEKYNDNIDYSKVHERIAESRAKSLDFLKMELDNCK